MRVIDIRVLSRCSIFFPHYLIKGRIFTRETLNIKYVFCFSLQNSYEPFLILRIIELGVIKNVYWSSCKVHIILVLLERNLHFFTHFRKIHTYNIFLNIRPG